MTAISIDFETCSVLDLRKVGAFRYVEHPTTEVTCAAYLLPGDNAPRTWVPTRDGWAMPADLRLAVSTVGATIHAWNAGFEACVFEMLFLRHGWALPHPTQYRCSMALASYWGLPAGLEEAGKALALNEVKLAGGQSLMLQMARPRSLDPIDGKATWWHVTYPAKLDRLVAYCVQDVLAERAAERQLQAMPEIEHATWLLDQEMNGKGIPVDLDLVEQLGRIVADAGPRLNRAMAELTQGQVKTLNQVAELTRWLQGQGVRVTALRRDDLEEVYYTLPEGPARAAIRLRLDGARASTAKLRSLVGATCSDGTVKGMLRYFGASRTGRWSGAGGAKVQPQNLPRPARGLDVPSAIRAIERGATAADLDMVYEQSPMTVVSSCLRGCFVAPAGERLVVADFSQIEARVLACLAGQQDILEVFARGEDVYTYDTRKLGGNDRQLGKTTRLGLGFQMGAERFVATAATYGITLTLDQAENIVAAWRQANPDIVRFWYGLDDVLRQLVNATVGSPQADCTVGPIRLVKNRQGVVLVYLPSGRPLAYRGLRFVPSDRGRQDIVYSGVNPKTKQWGDVKLYGGKLTENLVQATARDAMRDAMLATAKRGIDLRLTVHDELIALAPEAEAQATLATMLAIMRQPPAWLPTLPVWAEGTVSQRYGKG